MASFTAEQFRTLIDAMKLIENAIREDISAPLPSLPPDLTKYIASNPTVVAASVEELLPRLKAHAQQGARFEFAIGLLPDGRVVECTRRTAQRWGLKIVAQGDHDTLLGNS